MTPSQVFMSYKSKSAVALGTFDGLHIGHRHILHRLIEIARENNLISIALTLCAPVRSVPGVLSTPDEKIKLLRSLPLDEIIMLPNTSEVTRQPAEVFFHSFIRNRLKTKHFVVGEDFAFGHGRQGNIEWLKKIGNENRIEIHVVKPLFSGHKIISSSLIRELLAQGHLADANKLLGRFYSIESLPVKGRGVASKLGFPTINLKPAASKILPGGVFCGWVSQDSNLWPAVINIGKKPTLFSDEKIIVEAHILGFKGEWPRRKTAVHLCHKLREEMKFSGINSLKKQITKDIIKAKKCILKP